MIQWAYFVLKAYFVAMVLCLIVFSGSAWAQDFVLSWTANTETDLAGYKVYRTTAPSECSSPAPLPTASIASVGLVTTFTDSFVIFSGTVCWEITAVDTQANESARSNRVTRVIVNLPPSAPSGLTVATP